MASIFLVPGPLPEARAEEGEDAKGPRTKPPSDPAKKAPANSPYRVAAEQILFRHAGAFDAKKCTRSPEECLKLALETASKLREGKLSFADACQQLSEDSVSREKGGFIGIFQRGQLAEDFRDVEDALFSLSLGEISEPVESPFGLHIFRRIPIEEWAGAHILIQFAGCRNAPPALKRTRQESLLIAEKLLDEARRPQASFPDLARRHSEAPDRVKGGSLGIFTRHEILAPLEKAISGARIEEVMGPVETDLGWHIVRRDPIARAAHILIRVKGKGEGQGASRTREEGLKLIEEILAKARAAGSDFAALARRYSEDATATRGGDVGLFTSGERGPEFEKAAFALLVGEVSGVFETADGFHILKRLPED